MNTTALFLFTGFYLLSCVPMIAADYVRDQGLKVVFAIADIFLTVVAYYFLVTSFDSLFVGIVVSLVFFLSMAEFGEKMRASGYDPYGLNRLKK